jgi:hypothetical protein
VSLRRVVLTPELVDALVALSPTSLGLGDLPAPPDPELLRRLLAAGVEVNGVACPRCPSSSPSRPPRGHDHR